MRRHCITEGFAIPPPPTATFIQLRAKGIPTVELLARARALRRAVTAAKLLINTRMDVCLASGADGIHLPAHQPPPIAFKKRFGESLIVGVSCHSIDEAQAAEQNGADYIYISPIFPTPSKPGYGPPLGVRHLERCVQAISIPVIALGGVTPANEASCLAVGAAGIAGITFFR
jgi:thiamine-phosphate pyrophosphorylase